MRQSVLLSKTRKENPADEVATSARLLMRAGFVAKEMAGVYSWLPLGLRTLNRIVEIIREEMLAIGGVEISMSALQDPEVWKKTDRWDDKKVDIWFKTALKNGQELGLALTHEDPLTRLMRDQIDSYRDLPRYVFQFQTKFRNELRAKNGLLRTREFLMKDLYSFTATAAELDDYYEKVATAYRKIFERVGLGDATFRTFASGGIFSKFSDEFQIICAAGEDTVYLAKDKSMAINKEVFTDEVLAMFKKQPDDFTEERGIEVGNIFKQGTRYSEALGLMFTDEQGKRQPVVMGSYGIGPARVMAALAEVMSDQHGLVWPKSVTPFDVHVIELNPKNEPEISEAAKKLTHDLEAKGISALCDERDVSAGTKFSDSDLIGIPTRVVVSAKTLAAKKFEIKDRTTGEVRQTSQAAFMKEVQSGK